MIDNDCQQYSVQRGEPIPVTGIQLHKILPLGVKLSKFAVNLHWICEETDPGLVGLKIVLRSFGNDKWLNESWLFEHVEPEKAGERPCRIRRHVIFGHLPATVKKLLNESRVKRNRELDAKEKPVHKPKDNHHSSF